MEKSKAGKKKQKKARDGISIDRSCIPSSQGPSALKRWMNYQITYTYNLIHPLTPGGREVEAGIQQL